MKCKSKGLSPEDLNLLKPKTLQLYVHMAVNLSKENVSSNNSCSGIGAQNPTIKRIG